MAYMTKPYTRDELLEVLLRVMGAPVSRAAELVTRQVVNAEQVSLDVLVVEDNVVNQKLATALLKRWGHRVSVADNGQVALEALAARQFDLVFMDMMMPVMDGMEATRRFRATEQGRRTPIVAMTANAMQGDRERCIAVGMDDYISKPIEVAELQRLLNQYMTGRSPAQLEPMTVQSPAAEPSIASVSDFDYDLALSQADQEVVGIIADIFLEQWPLDKQRMQQALLEGDLKTMLHTSHAMKGTLAMFGAKPASELAYAIEQLASQGGSVGLSELLATLQIEVDYLVIALHRSGV
jgi:CheY-like chemotaxis protein/HPt (histidine-containing phosphotransfer) domain-containing protein